MNRTAQSASIVFLLVAFNLGFAEDRVLFRFDAPESANSWRVVNDGVMGGRSVGSFNINAFKKMEFSGVLSLENNGGFSSVRAGRAGLDLRKSDSIVIRVRGDGRQYNFNLYTQTNLGGYSYRKSFQTKQGEWVEVKLPLDQFVATWRGRVFPDEKLEPGKVAGMGFLLGDKKPGPFKLEVEWIKANSSQP